MFACLYAPDFPVQAALLSEQQDEREALRLSPIVVLDGPASLLKVIALNDPARRAGIEAGMTKLQVEVCSRILIRKRSKADENSAQAELLMFANAFSPRVESTSLGIVILDLDGTERLFGTLENIAQRILSSVRERGFHLHIGIAANPDSALYAAMGFPNITIIPSGKEADYLGRLSVALLPITAEMLEILIGWGIRTFQALAVLPEVPLTERLGQEGLCLQKLARGHFKRTLVPVDESACFIESHEFDDPVETLESLLFVLNRLLVELCVRLASRSFSTNELHMTLDLDVRQLLHRGNAEQYQHDWKLPVPTQDKNVLLTLVRLDLERQTFSAPIRKITLEAAAIKPRLAQGNLFAPPSPEVEKLEITLMRIRGVVGDSDTEGLICVGSPKLVDSYKPDSFSVQPFSSIASTSLITTVPTIAMRVFRPVLETSVELTGEAPHFVRFGRGYRRVLAASGPWCCSGNWWNDSWERQEWDVALKTTAGIGFYRIYLDQIRERWFVEGIFD